MSFPITRSFVQGENALFAGEGEVRTKVARNCRAIFVGFVQASLAAIARLRQ